MAEYAVVNKTQLDADMTSVADTIRTKGGTSEKLSWPDGYNAAIEAIQTGGGITPPASKALDPDVVYAMTRPADWLPMPTPGDDEIYILCHVINGLTATFKANLTITGSVTVEFGTITDGVFVAQETVSRNGTGNMSYVINSANYGNLTSDGMVQCMVRIKGPVTIFNGAAVNGPHPGVEFVCGIDLGAVRFGYTPAPERCWYNLRYVSFVGDGGAKSLDQAFYSCLSLVCVRCEKENIVNNIFNTFRKTPGLVAASANLIAGTEIAVEPSYLFAQSGINYFPNFKIKAASFKNGFQDAVITDIDMLDINTSECESMEGLFRYGYPIRKIVGLDISSLTTTTNMFSHLQNLSTLVFAGETTKGGITIDINGYDGMTHTALVVTINSLPTATTTATLDISDCGGKSELTEEEIAVATAKNWTLTI